MDARFLASIFHRGRNRFGMSRHSVRNQSQILNQIIGDAIKNAGISYVYFDVSHSVLDQIRERIERKRVRMATDVLWTMVQFITGWLDKSNSEMSSEHDDAMRVMKIGEEIGEASDAYLALLASKNGKAVQAYIGMVGQNPRKGITHTQNDLLDELADVAVTALCAIQHFTGDIGTTEHLVRQKTARIWTRASRPTGNRPPIS